MAAAAVFPGQRTPAKTRSSALVEKRIVIWRLPGVVVVVVVVTKKTVRGERAV
jgi:hypothetical protein